MKTAIEILREEIERMIDILNTLVSDKKMERYKEINIHRLLDHQNLIGLIDSMPKDLLIHGNTDSYQWGYQRAIDKACEWLRRTQPQAILPDTTIERFRKAMEARNEDT